MPKKRNGFTLIELLIVISIITILATFGINTFAGAQKRSRDGERKSDLKNIQTALRLYYNENGSYPTSTGAGNARINGCGTAPNCNANCAWNSAWTCGASTYMGNLPGDPQGVNEYRYQQIDSDNYTLQACLENTSDPQAIDESDGSWCDSGKMFELRP